MNRRSPRFPWTVLALLFLAAPAAAHPGHDDSIAALGDSVRAHPRDPAFLLQRAELYRLEERWTEALADIRAARDLDPDSPATAACLAALELDRGRPRDALRTLAALSGEEAEELRSRALEDLGLPGEAAAALDRALAQASRVRPEQVLRRARLVLAADPGAGEEALAGLVEGISRLGPAVSLIREAASLEAALGRTDRALARIDANPAAFGRPEERSFRKAEILAGAGRGPEAAVLYTEALERVESLPSGERERPSMRVLERAIRAALRSPPSPESP